MKRFDAFAEQALYGPDGFYTRSRGAGTTEADFITSPETSNLFGACVASYLDRVWHELGEPNPFVVVEGGSGNGKLCRDIFLAAQDCAESLRYVMVERSDKQRDIAFRMVAATCFTDSQEIPVAALRDLPHGQFTGVVIANELLDNLPPRIVKRTGRGWSELHVEDGSETWRSAPEDAQNMATAISTNAPEGACLPLQLKAAVWTKRALQLLDKGRLLVVDYGFRNSDQFLQLPRDEWLRTYRGHRRAGTPFSEPGSRDITCDVAFDQLPGDPLFQMQADWLKDHGLIEMTEWAREHWRNAAISPDARDVAIRSLLDEATALTDKEGLGNFVVAEWRVGD